MTPPRLRAVPAGGGPEVAVAAGRVVTLSDDRLVAGLVGADRRVLARLEVDGRRVDRRGPAGRVRAGLTVVSGTAVAGDLSVRDHLAAAAGTARADALLGDAPLLAGRADDPAGVLSGGERRILGWLVAVALEPRAVVLDRAGAGLDRDALAWAHRRVDGWLGAGAGVLVRAARVEEAAWVTHDAAGRPRDAGTSAADTPSADPT